MIQIDPEIVEKFDVSVVFDAISVEYARGFVIKSNTNSNKRTSYASHLFGQLLKILLENVNFDQLKTDKLKIVM